MNNNQTTAKILGFRTNKVWKKILSVIYLVCFALFALGGLTGGRYEKITVLDFWIDKLYTVILLLMFLSPYIFLSNTKFRDKLPLFKKHNGWISTVGMIIVILVIAILSDFVNNLHSKEYLSDMENHAYIEVSKKDATCEADGKIAYHCEYCGIDTTKTVKATGHTWDNGVITTEATCTETGINTYTCTTCNDVKNEDIKATGHTMKQVSADKEEIVYKCESCGEENIETTSQEKTVESKEEKTVTFEEIYTAYKNNELSADDTYKGNRYRITCTFSSVGDGGLNGLLGSLSVTAYAYANGTQCVLWCTFDEDTQREALSKLNKGDQFTFEGICDSWGNWSDCKIVE